MMTNQWSEAQFSPDSMEVALCNAMKKCLPTSNRKPRTPQPRNRRWRVSAMPEPYQFIELAACISIYQTYPPGEGGIAKRAVMAKSAKRQYDTLIAAAQILRDSEKWLRTGWPEAVPQMHNSMQTGLIAEADKLAMAATVLEELAAQNQFMLPFAKQGPLPRLWAELAPDIAARTIKILRDAGHERAGLGRADGIVVKFVRVCLIFAVGKKNVPAPSTIHAILREKSSKIAHD